MEFAVIVAQGEAFASPCSDRMDRWPPSARIFGSPCRGRGTAYDGGMKTVAGFALAALVAGRVAASTPPPAFDRYQVILDRQPFGEIFITQPGASNAASATVVAGPGGEALGLRACSLIMVDGIGPRAGLVEVKTSKSYFLLPGETQEGIKLVSADYDAEEIVIQRGTEMAILRLKEASTSEKKTTTSPIAATSRLSFEERRKAFEQQRTMPPPQPTAPPVPKLQGAELEKHLQQYQMEVIRQGMPPLPIPLTQEMDSQLVNEGVLAPQAPVVIQGAEAQIIIQQQ